MRRRNFIAGITGAVATCPVALRAQSRKVAHVGWLAPGRCEPDWTYFRKSMADLGWIEAKTIDYAYRSAGSDLSRIDGLAAELVGLKVDVLVAYFTPAINAAHKATPPSPSSSTAARSIPGSSATSPTPPETSRALAAGERAWPARKCS